MKPQALDIGHLPTAPSSKLLSRSSVWKMRNSMDRTDTRQRLTRYFFFFFGLCATHVSHNELSPPGYRPAFRLITSSIRRSVATPQRRGFQLLILAEGSTFKSFPILRTRLSLGELMLLGPSSLFIPLPARLVGRYRGPRW